MDSSSADLTNVPHGYGCLKPFFDSPIPPSLALAAIGESELDPVARRREGRYFTDSGLALESHIQCAGSGIVQSEVHLGSCLWRWDSVGCGCASRGAQCCISRDASWCVMYCGVWTRNRHAVRAARVAISSLTDDLDAVAGLCRHLLVKRQPSFGHGNGGSLFPARGSTW